MLLYGEPFGTSQWILRFAEARRSTPLDLAELPSAISTQFDSYWARFGWMNVFAPQWFGWLMRGMVAIALAGLVLGWLRRSHPARVITGTYAVPLAATAVIGQEALQLADMHVWNEAHYQGRYLFPMIAPAAMLLALGMAQLAGAARAVPMLAIPAVLMFSSAAYLGMATLPSAYRYQTLPQSTAWFLKNKTDSLFGQSVALRGCEVDRTDAKRLMVTLYWQSFQTTRNELSAFVHLVDREGKIVAQVDGPPGVAAGYPSRRWHKWDLVRETRTIEDPNARCTAGCTLRIGIYAWPTLERLNVDPPQPHGEPYFETEL
jgi:hypothetical protein